MTEQSGQLDGEYRNRENTTDTMRKESIDVRIEIDLEMEAYRRESLNWFVHRD